MKADSKSSVVYVEPQLHRALKVKAAQVNQSISELVNRAVRQSLAEDLEDLAAFEERKNEPDLDFEEVLKELRDSGYL